MNLLKNIPYLGIVLLLYNVSALAADESLRKVLLDVPLMSGGRFVLDYSHLLLMLGVIFLAFEIVKSTRTTNTSILDHGLSMAVFVIFIIEFIVVEKCGTATFLTLALMSLVDVIAGFTVTLSSAKRDVSWGNQQG